MKSKEIVGNIRVIIARLYEDEDIIESLVDLTKQYKIKGGLINGIGAIKFATLRFYNQETQEYENKEFNEDLEVTSLMGNISWLKNSKESDDPIIHVHANLGKKDCSVIGGHLASKTIVGPTLEVYIFETDKEIHRSLDEKLKLTLLDL